MLKLTCPHEKVDFWQFLLKIPAITLRKTARNDEPTARTFFFESSISENGIDRLLRRLLDEGTGVDDEESGLRGLGGQGISFLRKETQKNFGVDQVLRTAQGDETD